MNIFTGSYISHIFWQEDLPKWLVQANYKYGDISLDNETFFPMAIALAEACLVLQRIDEAVLSIDQNTWIRELLRFFISNRFYDHNSGLNYGDTLTAETNLVLEGLSKALDDDFTVLIDNEMPIYELIGRALGLDRFPYKIKVGGKKRKQNI